MTIPTPARALAGDVALSGELEEIRQILLGERRVHLDRLAWLEDDGTHNFDDKSATSALRSLLIDIDAALQRLQDGTYGTCQDCGRPVPVARLRALPHTTHCVDCA
jgi:RNA polymerase-binding transcription factor DksA